MGDPQQEEKCATVQWRTSARLFRVGQVIRLDTITNNIRSPAICNRKYHHKKLRRKKQSTCEDKVDIQSILRSSESSGESSGMRHNASDANSLTAAKQPSRNVDIQMWQRSQERTSLLRKGEKRVAFIAVVSMLIGFVAIKSFVSVGEKWRISSDSVGEQPS
ncbi:uncharacterized protein LOC111332568 isoform X2 [Stylophora pistillata]|uniref:uncharacterized protein LOC111332568 isoform X2 n=1 Tax=Stylophora pistillata TaxID=50429 RepID=UPI000C048AFA|nr:uncharacterized protein LOC111332568 isoform X2 [Stylophora pistillata]